MDPEFCQTIEFGLYLHIPFCETKCGYCDFYSVPLKKRSTGLLISKMIDELTSRSCAQGAVIRTVFAGGGTPTVLPQDEFCSLFEALRIILADHAVNEFTVEANPATVDDAKLDVLVHAGVDRLSMGAQSWHEQELAALERLHSPLDIAPGVALARKHGIRRINLDLMFGISGQTLASWDESLRRTIDLGVEHISVYGLTYEPGTRLTAQLEAGQVTPASDDICADMYYQAIDTLEAAGYQQYEISNFAEEGEQCRHNVHYWRNRPYIGVGPSACGYYNGIRYRNVADVAGYVQRMDGAGNAVYESEQVTGPAKAGETLMMQLRLNAGIHFDAFAMETGFDLAGACARTIAHCREAGLLHVSPSNVSLTRRGRLLCDAILTDLYAEMSDSIDQHGSTLRMPSSIPVR